jgi:hypothetical protein
MSPNEFEFLINLIGEQISRKDTMFRKAILVQERLALTLRFLASGDSYVMVRRSCYGKLLSDSLFFEPRTRCLTTANKPSGMRALRCPTQGNRKRTAVQAPESGTVPKHWECLLIKLSTKLLDDYELMSNCIPEFQQIIHIPD